jgi:hypothetical protein
MVKSPNYARAQSDKWEFNLSRFIYPFRKYLLLARCTQLQQIASTLVLVRSRVCPSCLINAYSWSSVSPSVINTECVRVQLRYLI